MIRIAALLFSVIGCSVPVLAQSKPMIRTLHGKVVKSLRENVSEPIPNANITLEQTGKSVTSNSAGLFYLPLPQSVLAGEAITVNIDAPGYAIFHPVEGKTHVPRQLSNEVVSFELLPLGSPRFFSHEHLVALVNSVAEKSARDVRSIDDKQKGTPDLSRYLEVWAHQYGFGLDQVKAEVDRWANAVEKKQDSIYELGLAAFAMSNFSEAGGRFFDSARQNEHKLQEVRRRERQLTTDTIRDYRLAGDSYANNYDFAKSAELYEKALSLANRQTDPQLWADLSMRGGIAHWNLGIRADGAHAMPNLLKAREYYKDSLEIYTRAQLPQDWARTQNNLGVALSDLARRSEGPTGEQALKDAVSAFHSALEVRTREQLPQDWAATQNNLGNALRDLASRSEEATGEPALKEAVSLYRSALEVYTRGELPQDWAMTQNNLGAALSILGKQSKGVIAEQALKDAVSALRSALEVRTREQLPQDWAVTQNNLGIALSGLAGQTEGAAGEQTLKEAVSAYRSALEVYTRGQLPQDWARTQNNLGVALSDLAGRSEGATGEQALKHAVSAYRSALEVFTENDSPFYWIGVTQNLADAYEQQRDWPKEREAYVQLLRHDSRNTIYKAKIDELVQRSKVQTRSH